MALTTIQFKPGTMIDRKLVSEQRESGVLASMGSNRSIGLTGTEVQYIDFEGEMGVFGEDNPLATNDEKTKTGSDATNFSKPVYPITFQISHRFPKRFLEIFTGNGYDMPTGMYYTAGDPKSTINKVVSQPYQADVLEQFKQHVNLSVGRALDMAAMFGVNPKTMAASQIVRQNGYLLQSTGDDWDKAKFLNWTRPAKMKPGETPANNMFKQAARDLAEQGDFNVAGVFTPKFEGDIADEQTSIGSPAQFAGNLPLTGRYMNIAGVPVSLSSILANQTGATAAGVTGKTVDGVLGNFGSRFFWDAIPLGGIEVFDTGDPDGTGVDLGTVNKVMLRLEVSMGWTFIGGAQKFRVITHDDAAPTRSLSK